MLTATYSLVAIRAEQDKADRLLSRLRQYIETAWHGLQGLDLGFLESAFGNMLNFDDFFRRRKVERYLIPVLRRVTREADALLEELDALAARSSALLRAIGSCLRSSFESPGAAAHEICRSMEQYCECVRTRIHIEDAELLPLARRVLSIEEWFSVAAEFLSADGGAGQARHSGAGRRRAGGTLGRAGAH